MKKFFTRITIENNPRRALNRLIEAMSTSSSVCVCPHAFLCGCQCVFVCVQDVDYSQHCGIEREPGENAHVV